MPIDIASPALRLHLTETDTLEEEVNLVLKKESRYLAWPAAMTLKKVVDDTASSLVASVRQARKEAWQNSKALIVRHLEDNNENPFSKVPSKRQSFEERIRRLVGEATYDVTEAYWPENLRRVIARLRMSLAHFVREAQAKELADTLSDKKTRKQFMRHYNQ